MEIAMEHQVRFTKVGDSMREYYVFAFNGVSISEWSPWFDKEDIDYLHFFLDKFFNRKKHIFSNPTELKWEEIKKKHDKLKNAPPFEDMIKELESTLLKYGNLDISKK